MNISFEKEDKIKSAFAFVDKEPMKHYEEPSKQEEQKEEQKDEVEDSPLRIYPKQVLEHNEVNFSVSSIP